MKAHELYELINSTKYTKSGLDVDWTNIINVTEKTIYLLFAPSNSKLDWINNFRFPFKLYKKQESKMLVAKGWGNAWKSCNDIVVGTTLKLCDANPDYKLIVSGYSFGGAIALLAAEDIAYRSNNSIKPDVITFGAPKPLFGKRSAKYVEQCCNSVIQFSHACDIITYLPPFIGYRHVDKYVIGTFNFFNLFKPNIYHTSYGDETLYKEVI